jgi:hypothetical protein
MKRETMSNKLEKSNMKVMKSNKFTINTTILSFNNSSKNIMVLINSMGQNINNFNRNLILIIICILTTQPLQNMFMIKNIIRIICVINIIIKINIIIIHNHLMKKRNINKIIFSPIIDNKKKIKYKIKKQQILYKKIK